MDRMKNRSKLRPNPKINHILHRRKTMKWTRKLNKHLNDTLDRAIRLFSNFDKLTQCIMPIYDKDFWCAFVIEMNSNFQQQFWLVFFSPLRSLSLFRSRDNGTRFFFYYLIENKEAEIENVIVCVVCANARDRYVRFNLNAFSITNLITLVHTSTHTHTKSNA